MTGAAEILFIFVAIAVAVATPVMAVVALLRIGHLRHDNELLRNELAALRREITAKLPAALPPPFEPQPEPDQPAVGALPPPFEPLLDREPPGS
ncbi:MAG TPA: hypothetical protein VEC14_16275, partial [Reyranellaceae bacterium]|nr:hypothetical protein [Reyranellaceae bacterium]